MPKFRLIVILLLFAILSVNFAFPAPSGDAPVYENVFRFGYQKRIRAIPLQATKLRLWRLIQK